MAAFVRFSEDNGAAVGSPARGTTRSVNTDNFSFKNTDSTASNYGANPITAGNNSYDKYGFLTITGSFNQILNGKFNHISGNLGAGITLKAAITSGYVAPGTATNSLASGNLTQTGALSTGLSLLFGTLGPESAAAATLTATGYSAYFLCQCQTTASAVAGDVGMYTVGCVFDEN